MNKSKLSNFVETASEFGEEALKRFGCGILEGVYRVARAGAQIVGLAGVACLFAMAFIQADRFTRSCMNPGMENHPTVLFKGVKKR